MLNRNRSRSSVTPLIVRWVRRTSASGSVAVAPLHRVADHREHPPQPGVHARTPVRVVAGDQLPVDVVLERAGEQHDQAHRVGAPPLHERHRLDDVALALRHRRAVVDHLALVHELRERLGEPDHAQVVEHLGEEPRVEQVQDRVLDPARVLADRHPPVDVLAAERAVLVPRRAVPEQVPARVDERVHRVGVARGLAAAATGRRRASRWDGVRAAIPRPAGSRRRRAAAPAARRRARRPRRRPGSARSGSARPSTAGGSAASRAAGSAPWRSPRPSRRSHAATFAIEPGECSPSNGPLLTITPSCGIASVIASASIGSEPSRLDHDPHRQAVLPCEREVALVVRGHGHDRAGAVLHQHVRRGVDGHRLAVDRVHRVHAEERRLPSCRRLRGRPSRPARRARSAARPRSSVPPSFASRSTAGCSTEKTKNVTPHSVSGRVVKTSISSPVSSIVKVTRAPSLRPIQLRCIVITRSGHSSRCPCRRAGAGRSR